jgi:Lar family restriction alleviation protein
MTDTRSSPATATLLPCPFCGKEPVFLATSEDDSFVRYYEVRCDHCGIEVSEEYKSETIERWNTRADPPVLTDEAARAPYAWAVERPTDPTFPRVCWTKEVADALVQHVNVAPPATVMPLYVGAAQGKPGPFRWRHKKRGSTYVEIGRGNLQIATDPVEEDDRVVIYQSEADGRLWVRGESEFQDGRFEALPMTSTDCCPQCGREKCGCTFSSPNREAGK